MKPKAVRGGAALLLAEGRALRHDRKVTFRLHRLRSLLTRPSSRVAVWLVVAAVLMGSATRIGFHAHAHADHNHNHSHGHGHSQSHDLSALAEHQDESGGESGRDSGSPAVLHGHDFGTVATLTYSDPALCVVTAPAATVVAAPAALRDSGPTAPPIRPPIA